MDRAYPFIKSTSNGDKCKPGRFYCHCGVDVPETGMKEHLAGHTAPAYAPYVQDASLVVDNAPQEEPLDPCSECGQLLLASEMIPWQAPNGSGLICQECHQAHKEIQSELKELSEETPAEPGPLPQPAAHCALCGGEFPLAGDPSLSCRSCELKAQERISSPRRDTLPEPQDNHGPTDSPSGIPEVSRACPGPGFPGTLTLTHAYPTLTRPFPVNLVEVKPGAVSNGKALALAYVDMRAYQARLDEVAGPTGWAVEYRTLGDRAVICRLTVLGISREDVGEADPEDANAWTSAVAQSFKRACASFGLGRYLYSLPRLWAEYDPQKKTLKAPERIVERMYKEAKL